MAALQAQMLAMWQLHQQQAAWGQAMPSADATAAAAMAPATAPAGGAGFVQPRGTIEGTGVVPPQMAGGSGFALPNMTDGVGFASPRMHSFPGFVPPSMVDSADFAAQRVHDGAGFVPPRMADGASFGLPGVPPTLMPPPMAKSMPRMEVPGGVNEGMRAAALSMTKAGAKAMPPAGPWQAPMGASPPGAVSQPGAAADFMAAATAHSAAAARADALRQQLAGQMPPNQWADQTAAGPACGAQPGPWTSQSMAMGASAAPTAARVVAPPVPVGLLGAVAPSGQWTRHSPAAGAPGGRQEAAWSDSWDAPAPGLGASGGAAKKEPDSNPFAVPAPSAVGASAAGGEARAAAAAAAHGADSDTEATEESDYDPFAAAFEGKDGGAAQAAQAAQGPGGASPSAPSAPPADAPAEAAIPALSDDEDDPDESAFGDLMDLLKSVASAEQAKRDGEGGAASEVEEAPAAFAGSSPFAAAEAAVAAAEALRVPPSQAHRPAVPWPGAAVQPPRPQAAPRGAGAVASGGAGFVLQEGRSLDGGQAEAPRRPKRQVDYQFNARTQRWEPIEKPPEPRRPPAPAAPAPGVAGAAGTWAAGAGGDFRPRPCANYPLGMCTAGAQCRYAHIDAELPRAQASEVPAVDPRRRPAAPADVLAEVENQARADVRSGVCDHSQALVVRLALRFQDKPADILSTMKRAGLPAAKDQRSTVKALMRLCHPDKCKHPEAKKAMQILVPLLTS